MKTNRSSEVLPPIRVPLDPDFRPVLLENRRFEKAAEASRNPHTLHITLERIDGAVVSRKLLVPGMPDRQDPATFRYVERQLKSLLWIHGGSVMSLSGPDELCRNLQAVYSSSGARAADVKRMQVVYNQPFEVRVVPKEALPAARTLSLSLGGHLDGCRIGFDLGASDYKLAAVKDGEPVFTTEIPWDPGCESNPEYHIERIRAGLKLAAEHLPCVHAIGGSAAGAYVANRVKYASLFRAVPPDAFHQKIEPLFLNLQKEWGVPLEVMNDGEVTALAGAMSIGCSPLLGIAMGSSEAAGFVNRDRRFTGNYHELAYVPVDLSENAAKEPIVRDLGCGAQYFSQQAVARLAPRAGFHFPEDMPLPERLRAVQSCADREDPEALRIFESIGVYLGYTLPLYQEYLDFEHVLLLGRVLSGAGGDKIIGTARAVLDSVHGDSASSLTLHVPDEKFRRVGQAVAAASLPSLKAI